MPRPPGDRDQGHNQPIRPIHGVLNSEKFLRINFVNEEISYVMLVVSKLLNL